MKSKPRSLAGLLLSLALLASDAVCAAGAPRSCEIATKTETIDGGTIAYDVAGQGRSILLLHGLFAAKEQWQGLICLLAAAGYTAIAPDLPGYGNSDGFSLSFYRLEQQVEILHRFGLRLRLDRFDVAGSSMGGAIASLYAKRYPGQVRTVAFIGSPLGIIGWADGVRNAIFRGINPFIPITGRQFELELRLLFVTPPDIPAPEKRQIVANYVTRNRHYVDVWNIVNLYDEVLRNNPPRSTPALIVWGREDRIYDIAGASRLQQRIPGSELHRLPNAGHLLLIENAVVVAPIYLDFLQSHRATGKLPPDRAFDTRRSAFPERRPAPR
jgi:abhydrolase domain-containing protein 6